MAAGEADSAARLIERLLIDPDFRQRFRSDPATTCRDAGLDDVAEEMSQGAGKAMETLDIRESRSSLAGVMMAAALEGIGVFAFVEQVVPQAAAAPGPVSDVLSRVDLPKVDSALGLRGALATGPDVVAPSSSESPAAPSAASGAAAAPAAPLPPAPAVQPQPLSTLASASASEQAPEADSPPGATSEPPSPAQPRDVAAPPAAPPAATPAPAPIDPAQLGSGGIGGPPSPQATALLENKNVVLDSSGIADVGSGRIDPRVVAVLTKLSADHKISVSSMSSDHGKLTAGGSVSNHFYGRGFDIAAVDGVPVNAGNAIARDVAAQLSALDPSYRPDEIGTPWPIAGPGYFTDAGHQDHLHVGFKQAIDPAWTPPADLGAASAAAPELAAPVSGATLSIAIPQDDARPSGDTLSIPVAGAPDEAGSGPTPPAGADAPADAAAPVSGGASTAGSKAQAALAEALKYKGTPYLWGGSNPQTGFDCSGLVQWAYAQQGIQIPRVTDQQILATNGTEVQRTQLAPGDLVFFRDPTGYVYHVGISLGGDRFLHAPRTGDVVKESSLSEPHYAERFAGGRRFDTSAAGSSRATPEPDAVQAASAAVARDAVAVRSPDSLIFKALTKQEAKQHSSTVQLMRAVRPEDVAEFQRVAALQDAIPGAVDYPGDDASKQQLATWLAAHAQKAGLPRELPVMAALVESGLSNLPGGDADSVGFFQMRVGIWNRGEYAGYPDRPELQAKWFIDHALAVKRARIAAGDSDFGSDPSSWGNWIADVERPAAQYRGRYQLRLADARALLGRSV